MCSGIQLKYKTSCMCLPWKSFVFVAVAFVSSDDDDDADDAVVIRGLHPFSTVTLVIFDSASIINFS